MYCTTNPASFLGCAPSTGPDTMIQTKRWATGLLEVLLSSNSPILATIKGNLQIRQCLAYMWVVSWGLRSIPELVYSLLPAYCLITGSHFLPKVKLYHNRYLFWFDTNGSSFQNIHVTSVKKLQILIFHLCYNYAGAWARYSHSCRCFLNL